LVLRARSLLSLPFVSSSAAFLPRGIRVADGGLHAQFLVPIGMFCQLSAMIHIMDFLATFGIFLNRRIPVAAVCLAILLGTEGLGRKSFLTLKDIKFSYVDPFNFKEAGFPKRE